MVEECEVRRIQVDTHGKDNDRTSLASSDFRLGVARARRGHAI